MTYSKTAHAKMQMSGWDETVKQDIDEGAGETKNGVYYPKRGLSFVEASFTYTGDLAGTSSVLYLISYQEGGSPVLAFERFEGRLGDAEGSFVLRTTGTQSPGEVEGHAEVVSGLGTGALASLRGEIDLRIAGESEDGYPVTLMYDLD